MIELITTGGTFDKVYFDALSEFSVGEPQLPRLLQEAGVSEAFRLQPLLRKDSLELTDADRAAIKDAVLASAAERILITHGTDTMVQTAQSLLDVPHKTIVLLGAMQPAQMRVSDAPFNAGFAWAAVQLLPPGVYLAMNGRVLDPRQARKNRAEARFESAAE